MSAHGSFCLKPPSPRKHHGILEQTGAGLALRSQAVLEHWVCYWEEVLPVDRKPWQDHTPHGLQLRALGMSRAAAHGPRCWAIVHIQATSPIWRWKPSLNHSLSPGTKRPRQMSPEKELSWTDNSGKERERICCTREAEFIYTKSECGLSAGTSHLKHQKAQNPFISFSECMQLPW